jgi:hypothetical protein
MASSDAFRSLTRHEGYYINGADLCLLIENVHFRVHKYFFERESNYFVRKLATPASPGQQPPGTQDSNAIVLDNVTPDQFAKFLWVFYNPKYSLYEAKISDWEIVLELSVRWEFPEIKSLAIRELEKKDIADSKRIKLYHTNNVHSDFLIPRYASLCERDEPLTYEEAEDIGMKTVVMIGAGREAVRAQRLASGGRTPLSPTVHGPELHEIIREIFKITPEPPPVTETTANNSNDSKKPNGANGHTPPDDQDPKGRKSHTNPNPGNANAHKKKNNQP